MKLKKIQLSVIQLVVIIITTCIVAIGTTIAASHFMNQQLIYTTKLPERLVNGLSRSYDLLKSIYVGEIDENKLVDSALSGFIAGAGDNYTSYLNESDMQSLQSTTNSEFVGIGVEIEQYGEYIRVVSPIDDTPAQKAGLLSGDLITAVDSKSIKGQSLNDIVKVVRGKKGTSVTLTISRHGHIFDVTITRDTIPIITVKGELSTSDKTKGVIRLSSFSKTTYDELVAIIKLLKQQGATSFVIDVRSNPGGLLESVMKIINIFVDNGKDMFYMVDKEKGEVAYKSSDSLGDFKVSDPVVILINKGSASASEIFASSLQELKRATIIGTTSFGKGTAQTVLKLTDTTGVKITYSKWLTPSKKWINGQGVEPDNTIDMPIYAKYAMLNVQQLIALNEQSDAVLNAQKSLQSLGYSSQLNGIFDDHFAQIIKQFQTDNGLDSTGNVDVITAQKINDSMRQLVKNNDTQLMYALNMLK